MANIIDFKLAKEIPISYKTFTITYRIQTNDRRLCRWYADVVKYPAYKITELEEYDKKSRAYFENESIERTNKYCEDRNEKVITWAITDRDNRKTNFKPF